MIGSLISAGVGLASGIIGGIKASEAAKKAKAGVLDQQRKNKAWYERENYMDETQRASAQRMLTRTGEAVRSQNRHAAGTAAVMGGTDESVALAKQQGNDTIAEAASRIVAAGDARKAQVEQRYQDRDMQLQNQLSGIETGRAKAIAAATTGAVGAFGNLGSAVDDWLDEEKAQKKAKEKAAEEATGGE